MCESDIRLCFTKADWVLGKKCEVLAKIIVEHDQARF